ncbi:MAG: hypothetical protein HY892_15030 [Deltaproteobacteria bacterium]|nr:hypothetical protein [Deltaproteobacteria bacterium]
MAHPELPQGELLRRAIHWVSERRAVPGASPLFQLIEEAGRHWDLSPKDCDFLIHFFTQTDEK